MTRAKRRSKGEGLAELMSGGDARRCTHCRNASWGAGLRRLLEAMLTGEVPLMTFYAIHNRLLKATDAQLERALGITNYRRPDGKRPSRCAIEGHIIGCEADLWAQIQAKRSQRG